MMLLIVILAVVPLGDFANITCPDSSQCPSNTTCCAWSSAGGYGCCPVRGGVCCKKDYCCDQGEICENHLKTCINVLYSSKGPMPITESSEGHLRDVPCSGSSTGSCPDNDTCCQGGCCPLPNAVCCSDGQHCCPANTVCDVSAGLCIGSKDAVTNKAKAHTVHSKKSFKQMLRDVPCSGSSTGSCPDNDTCCQGGCCPLPNAVCCSDGQHCCPQNTVCDVSAGLCIGSKGGLVSFRGRNTDEVLQTEVLKPALGVGEKIVYCPGGQYYCADYNTCCLLPSGQWGCCPYPSAVCCPDKVHCCPAGTRCDSTSTQCITSSGSVSSSQKFLARLLGKH